MIVHRSRAHPRRLTALALASLALLPLLGATGRAELRTENLFASIYVGGRKSGQIHFTARYGPTGEVEELKTTLSFSVLGVELYHHAHRLDELWKGGALQTLEGWIDENGTEREVRVRRGEQYYQVDVDGQESVASLEAYPISPWHYAITRQRLLLDPWDGRLLEVEVAQREEPISRGKEKIPATRFDFTGDWKASLWFDRSRTLLRMESESEGHHLVVKVEPSP